MEKDEKRLIGVGLIGQENPKKTAKTAEEEYLDCQKSSDSKNCHKKEYRYHRINLVINEKRYGKLREACECVGIDPSRIDDHDQDVIWDILDWVVPILRFRNKIRDYVRELGFKDVDLR